MPGPTISSGRAPSVDPFQPRVAAMSRAVDILTRRRKAGSAKIAPFGFQRILVAVDGTQASRYVAEWAQTLGQVFHGRIRVLGVVPLLEAYGFYGEFNPPPAVLEKAYRQERRITEEAVETTANKLLRAGLRVEKEVVDGLPASEIARAAKEWKAHLVVLGSNRRRAIGRAFFGSVVDTVKNQVSASVLIARGPARVDRILAATDGSDPSKRAAGIATRFAHATNAHVFVTYAWHVPAATQWPLDEAIDAFAEDLKRHEQQNQDPRISYHVLAGRPAEGIVAEADARDCGLVVVGSRGLGAARRMMLGSISNRVSHLAKQNVLIVREPIRA